MLELITKDGQGQNREVQHTLDELVRQGARRMIAEALELEVAEYIAKMRHLRDKHNHALVVRNGKGQERNMTLGVGSIGLRAPRVNDKATRAMRVHIEEYYTQESTPAVSERSNGHQVLVTANT